MAPSGKVRSRSTVCSVSMRELLLVIARAAHIRVARAGCGRRGLALEGHAIEPVFEHGLDMPIRAGAHGHGPPARRFHPLRAVLFREAQQAETGSIALLRVRTARQNLLDEAGGL